MQLNLDIFHALSSATPNTFLKTKQSISSLPLDKEFQYSTNISFPHVDVRDLNIILFSFRFSLNFTNFKQKPQKKTILVMLYVCQVCLNNANVRDARARSTFSRIKTEQK